MNRDQMRTDLDDMLGQLRVELQTAPERITEGDRLREDLGLDSINTMEFLSMITERYGVEFDLDEVQHVRTVGDVIDFLLPRVAA